MLPALRALARLHAWRLNGGPFVSIRWHGRLGRQQRVLEGNPMHRTQRTPLAMLIAVSVFVAIPPYLRRSAGVARADGNAPAAVDAPTVQSLAPMRDGFKWGIT